LKAGSKGMADVTTKLFLEEFEVMVDIGIHDFEINNPQRVCISVEVLLDPNAGDRPDEIGSTFDYDFIRLEIKNLISNRRFNLQETLCRLILEKIIGQDGVTEATVTTKKLDVYPDCNGVGVKMTSKK
jgi:dihydroneopterin aldolase|tara:strand:- start:185 stop:568 length:384 start_codon:yes stop_codon:yes gene_type:complete